MKKLPLMLPAVCFLVVFLIPIFTGLYFFSHASQVVPEVSDSSNTLNVNFLDTSDGKIKDMELEEYLVGVLAAEMPAKYELEALKAQAVAARSYIMNKLSAPSNAHQGAALCTDPNHCKGYIDEKTAKSRWDKDKCESYWKKLSLSVNSTKGEYMVYENEAIEAFFFARSGGRTENSEDVWGSPRPYLKSVASEEDKNHPDFLSSAEVLNYEARQKLNSCNKNIKVNDNKIKIGKTTFTVGGNVKSIELDGEIFKGTDIRKIFALKSSDFEVLATEKSLKFTVRGYGHGVGMSQFGANEMAKNGKKYTEILSHYYTNIQIIDF